MSESKHILHGFDAALESLRADVMMMSSLTERNLRNAMSCLLQARSDLCLIAIADDDEIDALEKKIDNDGIEILMRFQPVASDLRQVVSAMKLGGNIERVADQAVNIARRSRKMRLDDPLEETQKLEPMFVEAAKLFRDSVTAYADENIELARSLRSRDRLIDRMNHELANELTIRMAKEPGRVQECLNLIFVARHLERVGDHAKNIGEDAVYAAAAEDIRHPENLIV
jgi:phosphate transport system protein